MFEDEYQDYEEYNGIEKDPEYIEMVKDHLARANWQAIKTHGFDISYYTEQEKIDMLKEIIAETLQYFENIEEYEKCADLKRALDQI